VRARERLRRLLYVPRYRRTSKIPPTENRLVVILCFVRTGDTALTINVVQRIHRQRREIHRRRYEIDYHKTFVSVPIVSRQLSTNRPVAAIFTAEIYGSFHTPPPSPLSPRCLLYVHRLVVYTAVATNGDN